MSNKGGSNGAYELNLEELSRYFHLPITEAAKKIGVCATVLKKICRKNNIPRWPHRKIKSINKMISVLEESIEKNPENIDQIKDEIKTLLQHKEFVMKNPGSLVKNNGKRKRNSLLDKKKYHIHSSDSTNNNNNNYYNNTDISPPPPKRFPNNTSSSISIKESHNPISNDFTHNRGSEYHLVLSNDDGNTNNINNNWMNDYHHYHNTNTIIKHYHDNPLLNDQLYSSPHSDNLYSDDQSHVNSIDYNTHSKQSNIIDHDDYMYAYYHSHSSMNYFSKDSNIYNNSSSFLNGINLDYMGHSPTSSSY